MEYFIFAGLMAVAAVAFMLLAIFYYEYVPEGAYDEGTVLEIISDFCWRTFLPPIIWGVYFRTDQDLSEKSSISSNSDDEDGDEKKMKEISKAEEAGINDNNGNENEAFEEESF